MRKKFHGMIDDLDNVGFYSLKRAFFSSGSFVVYLWRLRSSDQDDHKREEALQWDMFPERTELLLIGCLLEPIWTPRSKSNTLTPRTNSQTYWQREISLVMNGSSFVFVQHQPFQFHQLSWSDVEKNTRTCRWRKSHSKIKADDEFGLTIRRKGSERACLDCIRKPGENQIWKSGRPLSSWNEQQPRTGRPVMGVSSSDYTEWNIDDKWSSQEWKFGDMLGARTGRPVGGQDSTQEIDKFVINDDDMDSDTATESNLSLKSRSILEQGEWSIAKDVGPFFNRCNARHRQIFSFGEYLCLQHWKHLYSWERIKSENLHSITNAGKDLTLKQIFDISEKLIVGQSEEIFGVSQISWKDSTWKQLSLVNDKEVVSLSHAKVYVFSDSVLLSWKGESEPSIKYLFGKKSLSWFKDSPQYRTLDTIDGEPMKFEWNIFPGLTTLQLINKVQEFKNKMGDPAQFQGRIIFMSMFKWHHMGIYRQWTGMHS